MPVATFLQLCAACQHEFRAPTAWEGRTVACPHCRRDLKLASKPAEKPDKLVGQQLGGCRLVKRLGAGAIGVVYEGEQQGTQRRVAVKMLTSRAAADDKVVARFEREAKLCATIQHPSVVGVYACGFERGVHYLLMEFIEGNTLATVIEEAGKLRWEQAALYILQVARGVEHAHSHGIVHRDIKPANILVTTGNVAKLADLGLAKQLEDERSITADSPMGLTMQGMALGSPAYMPPEQIRSAKDVTTSCDIYSLGATFYQAVTGALPFDGRTAPEVMTKVLREEPRPISELAPEVPPAIAHFIHRTLSKTVEGRPADMAHFIQELESAIANPQRVPSSTKNKPATAPTKRQGGQRHRTGPQRRKSNGSALLWMVVIIVVLATCGVLAWWYYGNPGH